MESLERLAFFPLLLALLLVVVLYSQSIRRGRELATLRRRDSFIYQMTQAVTRISDVNEMLGVMFSTVRDVFGADVAMVGLLEGEHLEGLSAFGVDEATWREFRASLADDSVVAEALRLQKPVVVSDFSASRFAEEPLAKSFGFKSSVSIPLIRAGETLGVLVLGNSSETRRFSNDDLRLMSLIGDETAIAISRARLIERLEKVDQDKDEFVSMVSHEIRGPLAAGKGFVDLLAEGVGGELNERQSEYLEVAQRNLDRVLVLIEDLQTITSVESGHLEISNSPENYGETIDLVMATVDPVVKGRSVAFETDIESQLPILEMDRDRVEQVLANLLSNAIKYTPANGKIQLRVFLSDGGIVTEVSDTGPGIPEPEQPRVFEKFFRSSSTKNIAGTGLGLAISKAIVEKLGGRIWFDSKAGEGSTFAFWLPVGSKGSSEGNEEAE